MGRMKYPHQKRLRHWPFETSVKPPKTKQKLLFEICFISSPFSANRRARKAIQIALSMLCLNAMQGYTILTSYITEIFANSSSNISAIDSSIFISSMLIVSTLVFMNLIDRAGRRIFYVTSSLAAALGLVLFALYLHLLDNNRAFDWVPLACVSYIIVVSSLGMNAVPFLVMTEIFPRKVRIRWLVPQTDVSALSTDKTLRHHRIYIVSTDASAHIQCTLSTNQGIRRPRGLDIIFRCRQSSQCIIRHFHATGNEG